MPVDLGQMRKVRSREQSFDVRDDGCSIFAPSKTEHCSPSRSRWMRADVVPAKIVKLKDPYLDGNGS